MKLLFTIHYPEFGGPHNHAHRLREPLARQGWEVVVLMPDDPGIGAERLRALDMPVVQMPLRRLRAKRDLRLQLQFALGFPGAVARIRRLIRNDRIDLVLVCGLVNPHAAIAARLEGVPVVWLIVDTRTPPALRRLMMPLVNRLADAVMFNGHALADLHVGPRTLTLPSFVYYPPVDTEAFVPSAERRRATRQSLGIPDDAMTVGMVANLIPQKGIEYFVRAAALMWQSQPDLWFLVVGAPFTTYRAYLDQLGDEVKQSGVPADRFIFAGSRTDVQNFYPAMDVKLITSLPRTEGSTTTAMEAMACGVPVVATDIGAVGEVITSGRTGFIVPALDPPSIADATLALLKDPDRRARVGEEGRRRAVELFSATVCAQTHVEAFETAIANHEASRGPRSSVEKRGDNIGLRVAVLCNKSQGHVDGIRDYSVLLAAAIRHEGTARADLRLRTAEGRWLTGLQRYQAVLLQYNPFMYGHWGFAPWLPLALLKLRRASPRPRIVVMVHESHVPMINWRRRIMGFWQRLQLIAVRLSADVVLTSTSRLAKELRASWPARPTYHLPVGSNLPDMTSFRAEERRRLGLGANTVVLVAFGTHDLSRQLDHLVQSANVVAQSVGEVVLLNLGAGAAALGGLAPGIRTLAPGRLRADDLARLLAAGDIYLAAFSDGVSTKRTTLMAALQHGLAVVGTDGTSTDEILRRSPHALQLVPADRADLFSQAVGKLANDAHERLRMRDAARSLYAQFDWPVMARNLMGALDLGGTPDVRPAGVRVGWDR